jgi:Ca2+-binding EF-hand superfamily protein
MHHNVSIQKCFEMIDTDGSTTISLEELKQALIRFNIGLKEKEIKIFLKRIDQNEKGYLS